MLAHGKLVEQGRFAHSAEAQGPGRPPPVAIPGFGDSLDDPDLLPFLRLLSPALAQPLHRPAAGLVTLVAGMMTCSPTLGWFLSPPPSPGWRSPPRHLQLHDPCGGDFFSIVRTASRWGERVVSHDATFRVLTRLRVWFWQSSPLSPAPHAGFRQADLLKSSGGRHRCHGSRLSASSPPLGRRC